MPQVESSVMTRVEYDEDAGELDITFTSGKTYRYSRVPLEIYIDLLDAPSKGEFFNDNIKDAFAYTEVRSRRER
jgi:KTSC domain